MKEKKNIFLGLLIAASLLLTIGCDLTGTDDGGNGGGDTTPTAVTFESAVQTGGTDGTDNSTGLTLTFSVDPTTLTADNITVTGATKGALSGTGTTRTLAISDITVANGETVSVAIAHPTGFTISGSPKTAVVYTVVYKDTSTAVTFESAVQTGGTDGTDNSTGLTLTFSVDPTTLTADDITLTGATKGALSGTGTTRTLAISDITVANGETVSVAIAHPTGFTISGSPKTAVVYTVVYKDTGTAVTFESAVQTGGTDGTDNSTGLTLTFSVDPTTLTADDITLTGATKGALSGTGTTRTLAISDITVANGETVSVAIAHPTGFTISGSPKTAVVYNKVYNLRDTGPAGGLIFYDKGRYSDGWRYLEVAPAPTEWTSNVWGGHGTRVTGADGTAIGTGAQNTIDIVTQFGGQEPYVSKTDYAAKLCSDLEIDGYDDWFLPSKDELDAIWDNLVNDGTGSNNGVGGFAEEYYWSSSEDYNGNAWGQHFSNGLQSSHYIAKDDILRVRAVRAF